jgi:hypothetical protein
MGSTLPIPTLYQCDTQALILSHAQELSVAASCALHVSSPGVPIIAAA